MTSLDGKRAEAARMLKAGHSVPEIGKKLGVPFNTIYGWKYKLAKGKLKTKTGKPAKAATPGKETLVYLRAAVADINRRMRSGELRERDRAHLLAELALRELESELLHKIS